MVVDTIDVLANKIPNDVPSKWKETKGASDPVQAKYTTHFLNHGAGGDDNK